MVAHDDDATAMIDPAAVSDEMGVQMLYAGPQLANEEDELESIAPNP